LDTMHTHAHVQRTYSVFSQLIYSIIVFSAHFKLLCRYELFMEAFNHIASNIDKIYKQLTKSNTHPLGGTAYLNLENEDDPFLHGIKYTTMPPTKRFRDMEQLSGGEKTVAALALLFSIHRYPQRPRYPICFNVKSDFVGSY